MDSKAPIGIFDSGVGGLSVLKALRKELPHESFIYLADSANSPYGRLTAGKIKELSKKNTEFLLKKNVKLIVVACNTATGAAIGYLRGTYPVPFVGMEPAVKPAAANSITKKIGVLATARTFEADHFNNTVNRFAGDVEVIVAIGDGLVELVEQGRAESREAEDLLSGYLNPMVNQGIDQLVLGCTHYPFLINIIQRIIPDNITVHDPAPSVARQTRRVLEKSNGLAGGPEKLEDQFFSTGDPAVMMEFVRLING